MRKPALSVILFALTLPTILPTIAAADSHRPVSLVTSAAVEPLARPANLLPGEIQSALAAYRADINRCYLGAAGELRATARLEILLSIHRTGMLDAIDVATPSLGASASHRVATCVHDVLAHVQFPSRRNSTTAVVPYEYQRTLPPQAGPQYSCWSPKGCKTRD